MRERGCDVINYVDNFLGFDTSIKTKRPFDEQASIMKCLGLTISDKK